MTYTPESVVGWLAHDDEEADEVRRLMSAFNESGTLDSLGLGRVRDALANRLSPGTSTIQTRARYFLFVPWICRQLEDQRTPSGRFAPALRTREVALIDSLKRGSERGEVGIVGITAGSSTRTLPSTLYWSGLGEWGIRQRGLSLNEYRRTVDQLYRTASRTTYDDDGAPVTSIARIWDPHLPEPPDGFPSEPIGLQLQPKESEYLEGKILTAHPGTLLAEVVRRREPITEPWPWAVPQAAFSQELVQLLHHAEMFSLTMHGARLLYCYYLARDAAEILGRNTKPLADEMADRLAEWSDEISARWPQVSAWMSDSAGFWSLVRGTGTQIGFVKPFVDSWQSVLWNGRGLIDTSEPQLRSLIVGREKRLKGRLARLSNRRAMENWQGNEIGTSRLEYRWTITTQIVNDIAAGWET